MPVTGELPLRRPEPLLLSLLPESVENPPLDPLELPDAEEEPPEDEPPDEDPPPPEEVAVPLDVAPERRRVLSARGPGRCDCHDADHGRREE